MNILQERDELLEAVKEPERKKSPNNIGLYIALIFANIVFVVLDVISAMTVYWLVGIALYGVLTFLAGAVPLLMHEGLYVRAFASEEQKRLAMTGAAAALLSIVVIGILAGVLNVSGTQFENKTSVEIVLIGTLVVIATFHAILAAAYFYIDNGILMKQKTAQAVARALEQGKRIEAGDYILTLTERSVNRRHQVGQNGRAAALREVLRQMGEDDDGDGIPNVIDPDWKMSRTFAQDSANPPTPPRK